MLLYSWISLIFCFSIDSLNEACLLVGDINSILCSREKLERNSLCPNGVSMFQCFIDGMGLID